MHNILYALIAYEIRLTANADCIEIHDGLRHPFECKISRQGADAPGRVSSLLPNMLPNLS